MCSRCTVSYQFWLTLRTLCAWTCTRVLGSTLTLSCSSIDDVVFTLMFVLTVSWFVLLPDSLDILCFVLYATLMPASCILDWCICFLLVFFTFVVVVEVIEEDVKDFILNFSVLIVNSLLSIVPGCVLYTK